MFAHHWETKDGQNYIKYGTGGVILVTALITACGCCVAYGSISTSLELVYHGVGAEGLSWAHGSNAKNPTLSIIGMMNLISNQSSTNPVGIFFLQAAVYIFTLIAPMMLVVILLVMWTWRLTVTDQEKLLYVAEIFKDWACLDVFVVAYVVTLFEVGNLADFIGYEAGYICGIIAEVEIGGELLDCFDLKAHPKSPGLPIICMSVVLLWLAQNIIMKGTQEAVHDREPSEHFERGHRPSSAFMDLLLKRTKPSPGYLVGKMLPKFIVKVGSVGVDAYGRKRYTSTAGSDDSFATYIRRKVSWESDLRKTKFDKPDMSFKKPLLKPGGGKFLVPKKSNSAGELHKNQLTPVGDEIVENRSKSVANFKPLSLIEDNALESISESFNELSDYNLVEEKGERSSPTPIMRANSMRSSVSESNNTSRVSDDYAILEEDEGEI